MQMGVIAAIEDRQVAVAAGNTPQVAPDPLPLKILRIGLFQRLDLCCPVFGHVGGQQNGHLYLIQRIHGSFARCLSVAGMAQSGVQGRRVLIDLLRAFGPERRIVGLADLQSVLAAQQVEVRQGDIVMLRTGYAEALLNMQSAPDPAALDWFGAVLDGTDDALKR